MYLAGVIFKFTGGDNHPLGKRCYKKELGKTRVKCIGHSIIRLAISIEVSVFEKMTFWLYQYLISIAFNDNPILPYDVNFLYVAE